MAKRNNKKLLGIIYPIGILLLLLFAYYAGIVNIYYLNRANMFGTTLRTLFSVIFLIIFHILIVILVYCYVFVMFTNPGEPPQFWGFNDRPEERRKRYCMVCNKFKPERCHHCSTCGRCVLVMDHHCPWLNNCVGFKTRKVFMLLLIYSAIFGVFLVIGTIYPLILLTKEVIKHDNSHLYNLIMGIVALVLGIVFLFIIKQFLDYHFDLINKNMTTIDDLNIKRGNVKDYNFDFGRDFNWKSIFGNQKICWMVPLNSGGGAPNGDGTVFMKNQLNENKIGLMEEEGEDYGYYDMDQESAEDWGKEKDFEDPLNQLNKQKVNNPLKDQVDIFGYDN